MPSSKKTIFCCKHTRIWKLYTTEVKKKQRVQKRGRREKKTGVEFIAKSIQVRKGHCSTCCCCCWLSRSHGQGGKKHQQQQQPRSKNNGAIKKRTPLTAAATPARARAAAAGLRASLNATGTSAACRCQRCCSGRCPTRRGRSRRALATPTRAAARRPGRECKVTAAVSFLPPASQLGTRARC